MLPLPLAEGWGEGAEEDQCLCSLLQFWRLCHQNYSYKENI